MARKGSKFQKYSLIFKVWIVEKYLTGEEGGARKVAQVCGLKSERQLRDWVKKYKAGELTAVQNTINTNKSKRKMTTKFVSKEEEFEYLKLENEYLKKKLLLGGESEIFIANLWSSKNLK